MLDAVRFIGIDQTSYKNGDKEFHEKDFYLADSTVFDMFTYELISGDPATALDNPFSMVVTDKIAAKYFGNAANARGQSLQNSGNESFKVTGVIKDVPLNSHFRFDALISESTRRQNQGGWGGFGIYTPSQEFIFIPGSRMRRKVEAT